MTFRARLITPLTASLLASCRAAAPEPSPIYAFSADRLAPPSDSAALVAHTLPPTLVAGSRLPVSVTLRNSGTNPWTAGGRFMLHWLPGSTFFSWADTVVDRTVAPGASFTFELLIVVPAAVGPARTSFRAAMLDQGAGFFGSIVDVPVAIQAGPANLDAALVSQNLPAVIGPGGSADVTIVMHNRGTSAWSPAAEFMLYNRNAPPNVWQIVHAALAAPVPPGADAQFSFTIRAPATGPFPIAHAWQMYQSGVGFFGDLVLSAVAVEGPPNLAAERVTDNFPSQLAAGATADVGVALRNIGSATWTPGRTLLYSENAPLNIWGVVQKSVMSPVPPGATAEFSLRIVAPNAPPFPSAHAWRLFDTQAGFFGPKIVVPVTVGAATPDAGVSGVDAAASDAGTLTDGGAAPDAGAFVRGAACGGLDPPCPAGQVCGTDLACHPACAGGCAPGTVCDLTYGGCAPTCPGPFDLAPIHDPASDPCTQLNPALRCGIDAVCHGPITVDTEQSCDPQADQGICWYAGGGQITFYCSPSRFGGFSCSRGPYFDDQRQCSNATTPTSSQVTGAPSGFAPPTLVCAPGESCFDSTGAQGGIVGIMAGEFVDPFCGRTCTVDADCGAGEICAQWGFENPPFVCLKSSRVCPPDFAIDTQHGCSTYDPNCAQHGGCNQLLCTSDGYCSEATF
jgi:hypothetical protein